MLSTGPFTKTQELQGSGIHFSTTIVMPANTSQGCDISCHDASVDSVEVQCWYPHLYFYIILYIQKFSKIKVVVLYDVTKHKSCSQSVGIITQRSLVILS